MTRCAPTVDSQHRCLASELGTAGRPWSARKATKCASKAETGTLSLPERAGLNRRPHQPLMLRFECGWGHPQTLGVALAHPCE